MPIRDPNDNPLGDASESDINRLVDDVLRSGKHLTDPVQPATNETAPRYHARAIAEQMQKLSEQLSSSAAAPIEKGDEHDEWWFELGGKRIGPISLHKIRLLWEDGELTPDSLCWHEGFPAWVSLFKVSELAEALTPKMDMSIKATASMLKTDSSGEWLPLAGPAMQSANKKRLESTQKQNDPLPFSTPLNLADERVGTYTAMVRDDPAPSDVPRRGPSTAVVTGLVAAAVAVVSVVATRALSNVTVPAPIVIVMNGGPVAAVVEAPKPVEPVPAAAPAAAKPVAQAQAQAPAAPAAPTAPKISPVAAAAAAAAAGQPAAEAEPAKPATVDEAFATAFVQPDELKLSEVMEAVIAHRPATSACVAAHRAASPDETGKLIIRWTVELDGHVTDVQRPEGEMGSSPLAECLAKEVAGWTFTKHTVPHPPVEFAFPY